ncbi:glycosyltransferase 1 domain-containing protein 1-like isoform X2 [Lineus longissimus]|uniref:glycosyltransferase 1 domain-containing protein 1-like isoform X2 n=1 Tax=Lineus longissimus TaxID=88925 RepID=UPI002B4DF4F9
MAVNILFLALLRERSGNHCTAARIRSHLDGGKYKCILKNVTNFKDAAEFKCFLDEKEIQLVVGLHAFHSGRLLQDCPVPYIVIFGGTDVNEHLNYVDRMAIMTKVVQKASHIVSFNKTMQKRARSFWPVVPDESYVNIPQAVIISPSSFDIKQHLKSTGAGHINVQDELYIFTLVAGIRPVKDPIFLLNAFSKWHQSEPSRVLLIVGPVIDERYLEEFESALVNKRGIVYIPGLPFSDLHAILRDSFALVNSSLSEGMSTALLEGLALGTPAIVRNIPGNTSVVAHRQTGMLYDTPQEFIECAQELIDDTSLREHVIDNAASLVQEKHSCDVEKTAYLALIDSIMSREQKHFK